MNPTSQRDEAKQGFESIPFIIHRYQVIERLRRPNPGRIARAQPDSDALVTDLENKMIQLYSKILEYQIRLVHQYTHNRALRYGRDVFKADEWNKMLSEIKTLDSECSQLAEELGQEDLELGVKENNAKIDTLLQSWNVGLQDLQELGTNTYLALDTLAKEDHGRRAREDIRQLLQTLRTKNPYQEQLERTPSRQTGTCKWFLEHPLFQTWRKDEHSRLLWVSANPGCGKSVLSKCLVEERLATLDPQNATICYFFFKDVSPDSKSITKALSAILHQLFTKIPSLVEHAMSAFDENGDELSSMSSTMWEILENAGADPRAGEIVCVLDALDECEEAQQISLIEKLKTFHSKAENSKFGKQRLSFLLTSRPYRNIRTQFHSLIRRFPTIHLSGDNESDLIKEEIDLVIHSEVSAIASERCFGSETEAFLLEQLLSIENRTYLWLHLILDQIRNSDNAGNQKALRKEIQSLPQSVSKAYETILAKTKDKKLASKLLHIINGAEAALTLQELNVAMSMEDDSRCYADLELESATAFELRIKNVCGLFIYTDRSKVFLIHQTAKEFLTWSSDFSKPLAGMWEHSLMPEESNSLLASICISLLMFDDFQKDPLLAEGLDHPVSTAQYEKYCNANVFLEYAAKWWPEHLKSSLVEQQNALLQKTVDLCNVKSRRCWTWLRVKRFAEDDYQPSGFTDLILASELGLVALVEYMLSTGVDVNARDKEGASALNRAVGNSNQDLVRILLAYGADIEAGDWDTPWREDIDENGLELEVKTFSGRPLMLATMNQDHDMMRALLAAGADIEVRMKQRDTPHVNARNALHIATCLGEESTMRVLLDHGADVNARTGGFRYQQKMERWKVLVPKTMANGLEKVQMTALEMAVMIEETVKVGLLLDNGADPEAEVFWEEEAGETDSPSLHSESVRKSVSTAAGDIDGQDTGEDPAPVENAEYQSTIGEDRADSFRDEDCSESRFDGKIPYDQIFEAWELATEAISKFTVLHIAASKGAGDVVRLLLEHGASRRPDLATLSEPTAIHLAALVGSHQVVKILLEQTANVDPKDHEGKSPLHHAVRCGYDHVVNELLEHGANTNAKDNNGKTSLHIAISMGQDLVTKDLLDYGADVTIRDSYENTPLHLAARKGSMEIVDMLLECGVDVDAQNRGKMTPMHLAALEGYNHIVQKLLVHGADANVKDRNEETPLHMVALGGKSQVIKELLDSGADINARNVARATPLHIAAWKSHDHVVKALLDQDADPNAKNIYENSPLHQAAYEGHDQVAKRLLDFGADINTRNEEEETPLHLAVMYGRCQVVKELLNHNADLRCETKEGCTVIDIATTSDDQKTLSVLREAYSQNSDEKRRLYAADSTEPEMGDTGEGN